MDVPPALHLSGQVCPGLSPDLSPPHSLYSLSLTKSLPAKVGKGEKTMASVSAGGAYGALGACCTVHMGCGHHPLSCPTGRGSTTPALLAEPEPCPSFPHPSSGWEKGPCRKNRRKDTLGVPLPPTKEKPLVSPSAIARSKSRDPAPVSGSKRVSQ